MANLAASKLHTLINKYNDYWSDQIYNKGYKVDYLLQRSVETVSKKTLAIEFEGKKYVLAEDVTLSDFMTNLNLPENKLLILKSTKDGFVLTVK